MSGSQTGLLLILTHALDNRHVALAMSDFVSDKAGSLSELDLIIGPEIHFEGIRFSQNMKHPHILSETPQKMRQRNLLLL